MPRVIRLAGMAPIVVVLLGLMLILGYARAQTSTPAAPTIDSVTSGDTSLAVAWTAPSGETGITAYDVRHIKTSDDETDDANWTVVDNAWTTGTLDYTITGLENGIQYDVQARAVNSIGDGTWSGTEVGTPALPAPILDAVRADDRAVFVSWSAPSGITSKIKAYDVRYIETGEDETVDANWTLEEDVWEDGGGSLTYVITGLTNDTAYDVQVRAVDEDDINGAWSPTTSATPEDHGGTRTDATSVAIGSRVWGIIDPSDDVDYFTFTVTDTADFWIYTLGDLDTVGELLDSNGDLIKSSDFGRVLPNPDGFFIWDKLDAGTYFVKVTGFGLVETPYILRVRAFPEHTGWPTAPTVSVNGSAGGTIDPDDDTDFFKIVLSEATEIALRASGFPDTVGQLYESGPTQLVASNDDGYLPGGSRNFLIRTNLEAGTYYLNVSSFANRTDGPFTVYLTEIIEPGSTIADAQPLTLGGTAGGNITPSGDEDYFSLTLDETTHVIVGGVSSDTDISAQLLDSSNMAAPVDSVHFSDAFVFQGTLDAGTYHLKVTGKETTDTGRYTVRAIVEGGYTYFENSCSAISRSSGINDPLYGCQWHLNNDDQFRNSGGQDIGVEDVWPTYTGDGINVAVVDDGMHYTHEDLTDNVDTSLNHNYDPDLTDIYHYFEWHGTAVAGLIAAKDNSLGVRGVAPEATIYGYNYLEEQSDANEADAMSRNSAVTAVSNNSWGSPDYSRPEYATELWEMAVEDGAINGYGGKGVVYVWSAGNGGEDNDYSNLDEVANFYPITAACAVGHDDKRSDYSESGSNLWICAPSSSGRVGQPGIATTDNGHRYRGRFGGTSAAAPIVSGVVALIREANNALTWRDVKLILAASARQNDPDNTGWEEGALKYGSTTDRYTFNHEYGFGMVDAKAATDLAVGWTNAPDFREITVNSGAINLSLPDAAAVVGQPDAPRQMSTTLSVGSFVEFIEYVEINTNFRHASFRDLTVELISPSGAVSVLTPYADLGERVSLRTAFRFGSAKHLGEDSAGEWTLRITDHKRQSGSVERLTSWGLTFYGHGYRPAEPDIETVTPGGGTLTIEWKEPTDIGASAITSYDLRYIREDAADKSDDQWTVETSVGSLTNRSYTITGLEGGDKYNIQVRANNSSGQGRWSDIAADEPTITPPLAPSITNISRGDRTLAVVWTAPTDTGGGSITAYDVRHIETSEDETMESNWTVGDNAWTSGDLRYVISNLANATEYDVQVRAVNSAGDGEWSDTETGTPLPDDIPITLQWEETTLEADEDAGSVSLTAVFTTTLNAPPAVDFTFDVTLTTTDMGTTPDDDYTPPPTSATFVASDFSQTDVNGQQRYRATRNFDVVIIDDTVDESDESVRVTINYLTPGLSHLTGGPQSATITIEDDEHVPVTISWDQSDVTVDEDDGSVTLTARAITTVDKRPEDGFSFDALVFSTNGSAIQPDDYTQIDETLTFDRADFSRATVNGERRYRATKQVTVTIADDTADEIEEDFTVNLGYDDPSLLHLQGNAAFATIKIGDNEYVPVMLSWEETDVEVSEDAGSITLYARSTTTVDSAPLSDVTFDVRVSTRSGSAQQNSDFTPLSETETILHTDFSPTTVNGDLRYRAERQIVIDITDDIYDEGDENFTVTLSYASSGLPYLQGGSATATVTITNDDEGGPVRPRPIPPPTPTPTPRSGGGGGGGGGGSRNDAPEFREDETTERSIAENTPAGAAIGDPVTARDRDRDTLIYFLRGDDDELFEIDPDTGQLLTKAPLDYETRAEYSVIVSVTDGKNSSGRPSESRDDSITVTISVEDMDEPGVVTLSSLQPQVDVTLTAVLTDPDGGLDQVVWRWERSADQVDWAEINGALTGNYTPVIGDLSSYLRVTASYTDSHGQGKSAVAVTVDHVLINTVPRFPGVDAGGDIEIEVEEGAGDAESGGAGEPVAGADPDGDTLTHSLSGADAEFFEINASTGQLQSKTPLDYETQSVYTLIVSVRDGRDFNGNPDTAIDAFVTVTIAVVNLSEEGTLTLLSPQALVGVPLVARLTDPDGVVGDVVWKWERSLDSDPSPDSWRTIGGARSGAYAPVEFDVGYRLRITASYADGYGPDKTEQTISDGLVMEFTGPIFQDASAGVLGRSVAENAGAGEEVGLPLTATSPNVGALTYTLGGADADLFDIDSDTGQLRVGAETKLDYEADDNIYQVTVTAEDSSGASATVAVTITVANVDVPGIANDYDTDDNEQIDRDEVIAALADYFSGAITQEEALEIVRRYFAG